MNMPQVTVRGCLSWIWWGLRFLAIIGLILFLTVKITAYTALLLPPVLFWIALQSGWMKSHVVRWVRILLFAGATGASIPLSVTTIHTFQLNAPFQQSLIDRSEEALDNVASSFGWTVVQNTPAVPVIVPTLAPAACPNLHVFAPGTVIEILAQGGLNVRTGPSDDPVNGYPLAQAAPLATGQHVPAHGFTQSQIAGWYWIVLDQACTQWVKYHDGAGTSSVKVISP